MKINYVVCLLGYDVNHNITDFEFTIEECDSLREAEAYFDFFASETEIKAIKNREDNFILPENVKYVIVQIEEVDSEPDEPELLQICREKEITIREEE